MAAVGHKDGADRTRGLTLLEQALRENPADVEVLLYLAEMYRNDGKNDLARAPLPACDRPGPKSATGPVGLGAILMESGDYAGAIRLWTDALSKNAGLLLVRLNLSAAYLKIGDRLSAERHLKQALDLNPAFAPAREMLNQLQKNPSK